MRIPKTRHPAQLTAVYFLFDADELVYIGQSKNMLSRIGQHIKGSKAFDSYTFIECGEDELDGLEAAYIKQYQPKLNTVGTNPAAIRPSITISERRTDQMKRSPMSDGYWARRLHLPERMVKQARR